jgi:hypothetical protein
VSDFGGLGGIAGGRPRDPSDLFKVALDRALGDKMRAEGVVRDGHFTNQCISARVWGSLANAEWIHENGDTASYSFRAAGDMIAAIIGEGDYIDWCCSQEYELADPEVVEAMAKEGWRLK